MIATDDHGASAARSLASPSTNGHAVPTVASNGQPASRPNVDQPRIERAVREILVAIGEDPDRDGLLDTPARVAREPTKRE